MYVCVCLCIVHVVAIATVVTVVTGIHDYCGHSITKQILMQNNYIELCH